MLRAIPIAVLLLVVLAWLYWGGRAERSREEVAKYIEDFIRGTDDYRDWDEFTSVSIKDRYLDQIRKKCLEDQLNKHALQALLDEVRSRAA